MEGTRDIAARILRRCRSLGFALAGICRAAPTAYERELLEWLSAGKHGEMEYLQRHVNLRVDPSAMVSGAKSIIVVADRYAGASPDFVDTADGGTADECFGRIARYARGDDYHKVMRKRLTTLCRELSAEHPQETFRACVDTAPVLEREHAQRAGIGAVGKNTLIIERGVGSYLLLGEIVTTMMLPPSQPSEPDPCGSCTRCIDACPTGAIAPWSVDATRCISYLTIEHRGEIDQQFHAAMGDWVFGCDICQEVCPHNQPTARSRQAAMHEAYTPRRERLGVLAVLDWDESARQQAFINSSMKRAKLNMMKRNALIVAGNWLAGATTDRREQVRLQRRIAEIAGDSTEDAMVRRTAYVTLRRLMDSPAQPPERQC